MTVETVMAVGRAQAFIEAHMTEKITMKQLADAAGYSVWHTARMFKELTGKSPFEYIRARRLAIAALRLRDGGERVLDVALDFTFDSNEGFTRAFTPRVRAVSPGTYARTAPAIPLFLPENVVQSYRAMNREEVTSMEFDAKRTIFAQVMERPARKILLEARGEGQGLLRVLRGGRLRRVGRFVQRQGGAVRALRAVAARGHDARGNLPLRPGRGGAP